MNNQEMDEKVSALKAVLIKVLWTLGAVVLVVAAYQGYTTYQKKQNSQAAVLFHKLEKIEDSVKGAEPTSPEEANAALVFEPEKILKLEKSVLDTYKSTLAQIDTNYSGTKVWALSQLRWGMLLQAEDSNDQAKEKYQNVISSGVDSPLYRGMASNALGVMFENQKDYDKAFDVYEKAAKDNLNPLKPIVLLAKARVLNAQNKEGAVAVYDQLIKDFPESAYSRRAKVLKSLQVKAR